jgi:hypothetical protein
VSGLLDRPVTPLDRRVLGDLFGSEEVRRAFDSSSLVQVWLELARQADVDRLADPSGSLGLALQHEQRALPGTDMTRTALLLYRCGARGSAQARPLRPGGTLTIERAEDE